MNGCVFLPVAWKMEMIMKLIIVEGHAKAIMRRNSVPYEAVSLSSMKSRATGPAIASRRMVQIHAVDRLRMNAVLIESFILFLFPDAYVKPISGTIPWEIPCPIA